MPAKDLRNAEAGFEGMTFTDLLRQYVACGILAIEPSGTVVSLSPDAERMLGGKEGGRKSRCLDEMPAPLQAVVRETQTTGQLCADRQIVLPTDSAGPLTLCVTVVPVPTDKTSNGVVVVLQDLSPTGLLERYLQRLDRLASVGTLSASMAHEIKNALVAVKTFVDLLLEKNPDAELAGIVCREMGRMDSIVGQMLKFAAPARPELAAVSLHTILDHSLRLVQHRVGDKMISFVREFHAPLDSFNGDDHQLEQAFVNLLLNAVESMGPEGTLTVGTALAPDVPNAQLRDKLKASQLLRVTISDTGTGIPPEHLERLFEPFFTTKQHGTGLGLPVTRRIIEEHQGTIQVESQPGHGATFTILLPMGLKTASA